METDNFLEKIYSYEDTLSANWEDEKKRLEILALLANEIINYLNASMNTETQTS